MNKLALALAISAIGATSASVSAQVVDVRTAATILRDRMQSDGTWRREGNTDIYVRTRIDANGNRVLERARRDALGNYVILDSRIVRRDDGRNRNDGTWNRSDNENRVYVRRRIDANGNTVLEKSRRDANGNFVIFDSKIVGPNKMRDRNNDGRDDRLEGNRTKSKDGKWKKDKEGKKWNKGMGKSQKHDGKNEGEHKGKGKH